MLCFGLNVNPSDFDNADAFSEVASDEVAAIVCSVRDVRQALDEGMSLPELPSGMADDIRALDMSNISLSIGSADDGGAVLVIE